MVQIHRSGAIFYCPVRSNRAVREVEATVKHSYQKVENLAWSVEESEIGKPVHLLSWPNYATSWTKRHLAGLSASRGGPREFPQDLDLKLFRVVCSTADTDFIVTNDDAPPDTQAVQQVQGWRWKVGQFHREAKQLTGLETRST